MLQAIVTYQHVGVRVLRQQRTRRLNALAGHVHRHLALGSDQQGFIADCTGLSMGQHSAAVRGGTAVSARHHAGAQPLALQVAHQGHHHRGFARPSRHHIAHHDDRLAGMLGTERAHLVERCTQGDQGAVELGHGPQRPAAQVAVQPHGWPALRSTASGLGLRGLPGRRGQGRLRCHAAQRLPARVPAVDCVAKVICVSPTRRAASITVTTD